MHGFRSAATSAAGCPAASPTSTTRRGSWRTATATSSLSRYVNIQSRMIFHHFLLVRARTKQIITTVVCHTARAGRRGAAHLPDGGGRSASDRRGPPEVHGLQAGGPHPRGLGRQFDQVRQGVYHQPCMTVIWHTVSTSFVRAPGDAARLQSGAAEGRCVSIYSAMRA